MHKDFILLRKEKGDLFFPRNLIYLFEIKTERGNAPWRISFF